MRKCMVKECQHCETIREDCGESLLSGLVEMIIPADDYICR